MAIKSTYHSTLGDIPHFTVNGEDRRLFYELSEKPAPVYNDDYVKLAIKKKQERDNTARQHLQVERDRIIVQQHRLARRKDFGVGMLVFP